jgi:N utilization substance protein A
LINRELIEVFSEIAREKNVERSELGSIVEQLFLHIIEKQNGDSSNCSVIVNIDKGEIEIYAEKVIVDVVKDPNLEITLKDVLKKEPDLTDIQIDDTFVEVIDPRIFGRRLIAHAKQFFSQRIMDVERQYIYEDYSQRVGEIVIGVVHQIQRDNVFVNIEHAELRMPKREQIATERYRRGDTVRAIIKSVEVTAKGPDIVISRSDNHFIFKLFEMEVPEIEDGIIDIKKIVRQPGERAKIIVQSHDRRIDAVGACVGMRGSRIQAIVRELNNEKIDIVNFSERPEILISRALSPAKPINLYIDDERKYCIALFNEDELDAAIGKGGVNINLASQLTEYMIDAYNIKDYERIQKNQETKISHLHDFPPDISSAIEKAGITTVGDLLNAGDKQLLGIKGIDESTLKQIKNSVQKFVEGDVKDTISADDIDESEIAPAVEDKNAIVKDSKTLPQVDQ